MKEKALRELATKNEGRRRSAEKRRRKGKEG